MSRPDCEICGNTDSCDNKIHEAYLDAREEFQDEIDELKKELKKQKDLCNGCYLCLAASGK